VLSGLRLLRLVVGGRSRGSPLLAVNWRWIMFILGS